LQTPLLGADVEIAFGVEHQEAYSPLDGSLERLIGSAHLISPRQRSSHVAAFQVLDAHS